MSQKTKIGSASASIAVLDVSMGWGQREERATRLDAVDTGEEYSDESGEEYSDSMGATDAAE